MAKVKTSYACSECGYRSGRWLGKCPECESWNTMIEQSPTQQEPEAKKVRRRPGVGAMAVPVSEIPDERLSRLSTGEGELDRVLGGGLVPGSMILVGGDPGIGKSTLLTQVSGAMARMGYTVLYASGEESARQIKMRAARLDATGDSFFVLPENDMEIIEQRMLEISPDVMIVDSIQTMYRADIASAPGSVSQVRESAAQLMRFAKSTGCALFLVGHVTKEGAIAGPRVLEHMVDAVLYFEGDNQHQYRLLRAVKNRFGSVNELGMFEMRQQGMVAVENPSEALLSERASESSGSVVMCTVEGSRPLLVDVQALVSTTVFGNPRRMASGVEQGRLALLLAVLEKRAALTLYNQDVYINVAGGLSLSEPAADLALCAAVYSSLRNVVLPQGCAVMGEVGLQGEVRAVGQVERRLAECARLGFTHVLIPQSNLRRVKQPPQGLQLHGVDSVGQALKLLGTLPKAP